MCCTSINTKSLPLKEISIFSLSNKSSSHHDGLETLSFDGPETAVGGRFDGCGSLAVVQDRQLTEHLTRSHRAEVLVFARNFDSAL